MKTLHQYLLILFIGFTQCSTKPVTADHSISKDTTEQDNNPEAIYRDSIKNAEVDTTTIEGKIQYMKNLVNSDLIGTHIEHDTLFDFNYDGHNDIFFRYYGAAGNFMKYNTIVCIYNPDGNYFYTNDDLRYPNASFFINKKKFTSFYGGSVREYHWENGTWQVFMKAEYDQEKEEWMMQYTNTRQTKTVKGQGADNPGIIIDVDLFYQ